MAAADWVIERLTSAHDRTAFRCGQPALDDWLQQRASQFDKRDLARAYVAVRPGQPAVLGYYAISNHRVAYGALPADQAKGLPRIEIPVVLLGRLAVDQSMQRQRLGELLLIDALRRSRHLANQIGVRAVEVDAIDDTAKAFYLKYGFVPLLDNPSHLFLPMQVIRKLNLPPLP
jgi:GNAT superfamily N-acetyltransferase